MRLSLLIILILPSCSVTDDPLKLDNREFEIRDPFFSGKVLLTSTSKGFRIVLVDEHGKQSDQTFFRHQPYQFDTADVDHDGRTDILVGLIKSTEFDPGEKRRLFILRIDEGHLRPLWLGSKVCQNLVNFKTLENGIVQTLEQTKAGNYCIGIYEWQGFGLTLINYTHDEKTYNEAITIFQM